MRYEKLQPWLQNAHIMARGALAGQKETVGPLKWCLHSKNAVFTEIQEEIQALGVLKLFN